MTARPHFFWKKLLDKVQNLANMHGVQKIKTLHNLDDVVRAACARTRFAGGTILIARPSRR
jgi:hypothetical protein